MKQVSALGLGAGLPGEGISGKIRGMMSRSKMPYRLSLLFALLVLAGVSHAQEGGAFLGLAQTAKRDLLRNFWRGDAVSGAMMREDHGLETQGRQEMIWAHATMLFALDTFWRATGDEDAKRRIAAQWAFTKANFTEEALARPGENPNRAMDDAGWDAMAYALWFRHTGDPDAMRAAKNLIANSYRYWCDDSVTNGLWYSRVPPSQGGGAETRFKSLYAVGLVFAALDYTLCTGDDSLMSDTLAVYEWIERHLRRDRRAVYADGLSGGGAYTVDVEDKLYWMEYNEERGNRRERNGPDGGTRPGHIREASSVSALFGNMAMSVIQARLYKMRGDEAYRVRALETVRALVESPYYDCDGAFLNDRDAWVNGLFAGWWVSDVLTLPGMPQKARDMIYTTARSISAKARTPDGFYGAAWGSGTAWGSAGPTRPEQIMTSASTVNVIMAAALLEKLDTGL